jgi:hypothetical protein
MSEPMLLGIVPLRELLIRVKDSSPPGRIAGMVPCRLQLTAVKVSSWLKNPMAVGIVLLRSKPTNCIPVIDFPP